MKRPFIVIAMVAVTAFAEDFPIRVNQAGFLPSAPKWCAMKKPPKPTFVVQKGAEDICWHTVYEGKWVDAPWGGDVKIGDFSSISEPGDYRILCGDLKGGEKFRMPDWRPAMQSYHFPVRDGAYDVMERMFLTYITWQRCGSNKGWAGMCHADPVPVKDADGRTVRRIDARGGYHQSCDLRNWHDGISQSMYGLLRYAELKKPLWDEGEIAAEIRWGCDYFLKVVAPEGYVYDAQFAPIGWGPRNYYLAPATLGAQCNVAMLFARASLFFRDADAAYAARLLAAARRIWGQIESNPFFDKARPAPEKNLPAGAQPAERCYFQQWRTSVNGISERAMAALELYRATGEAEFAAKAKELCAEFMRHLSRAGENAGWYMAEDGTRAFRDWSYCWRVSGPRVPLEMWRAFKEDAYRDAALCLAERIVRDCAKGGMRPGKSASSSVAAANSLYLSECAELFGRDDFRVWAQRSFDWIFGANPHNASYVEGVGQNQWQRPVFGQFFPSTPQLPGAVLHVEHGEYDMPPVTTTLWAAAALARGTERRACGSGDGRLSQPKGVQR
jgi:endoglucanase